MIRERCRRRPGIDQAGGKRSVLSAAHARRRPAHGATPRAARGARPSGVMVTAQLRGRSPYNALTLTGTRADLHAQFQVLAWAHVAVPDATGGRECLWFRSRVVSVTAPTFAKVVTGIQLPRKSRLLAGPGRSAMIVATTSDLNHREVPPVEIVDRRRGGSACRGREARHGRYLSAKKSSVKRFACSNGTDRVLPVQVRGPKCVPVMAGRGKVVARAQVTRKLRGASPLAVETGRDGVLDRTSATTDMGQPTERPTLVGSRAGVPRAGGGRVLAAGLGRRAARTVADEGRDTTVDRLQRSVEERVRIRYLCDQTITAAAELDPGLRVRR